MVGPWRALLIRVECALASFEPHHSNRIRSADNSKTSQPQQGRQAPTEPANRTCPTLRKHRNAPHILNQAPTGEVLIYPGGVSEVEILFPYGATYFASVAGPLAGNHSMTIVEGQDNFHDLGQLVQWKGAQDVSFALR
jgi:hypothetical protein